MSRYQDERQARRERVENLTAQLSQMDGARGVVEHDTPTTSAELDETLRRCELFAQQIAWQRAAKLGRRRLALVDAKGVQMVDTPREGCNSGDIAPRELATVTVLDDRRNRGQPNAD